MQSIQIPTNELTELCILPIGIEKNGTRYKRVYVDEMSGIDEHILSDKKNADKSMSMLLARCIQEIEGLVDRKKDPETFVDISLIQNMYQVDRDALIMHIQRLSGTEEAVMAGECPRCNKAHEEYVSLGDIELLEWPEDQECVLDFELVKGVPDKSEKGVITYHKKGKVRFPKGKDQEKLLAFEDDSAGMLDAMLAACITEVGELKQISQEQAKRMKSKDRAYISSLFQKELPGLRQWKSYKCKCGRTYDITMDIENFFGQQKNKGSK